MTTYEKLLKEYARSGAKTLFYPSCGSYNIYPELFDLDYDLFVLSDYGNMNGDYIYADYIRKPNKARSDYKYLLGRYTTSTEADQRRFWKQFCSKLISDNEEELGLKILIQDHNFIYFTINRKQVALFFWDNNITLAFLQNMGIPLSCFVGVNDGCQEDGNYECVNSDSWLKRAAELMGNNGLIYITDHREGGHSHYHDDRKLVGYDLQRIVFSDWMEQNCLKRNPFTSLTCNKDDLEMYLIKHAAEVSPKYIRDSDYEEEEEEV